VTTQRVLLVVIAALMLAWSPAARGQLSTSLGARIDYYIDEDGTGRLVANPAPYGQGSISWTACAPGVACSPIASAPVSDRVLHVGNAAPGTVFIATAVNGSEMASSSSVPYLGLVRSLAPPRIKGRLRVGALVKPQAGSWSGGWGRERSFLQTQVCKTAGGLDCVVVADAVYWDHCPGAGAVLTPAHLGRYVRVIDERIDRATPFLLFGVSLPGRLRSIQPGPAAAATVAGPIKPARGAPESNCGQPPRLALSAHPPRRGRRIALGRITCSKACRVLVIVRQARHRVRIARRVSARVEPHRLWLPARLARRLRPGMATVSASVSSRIGRRPNVLTRRVVLPGRERATP
jgi:hypothetical protein